MENSLSPDAVKVYSFIVENPSWTPEEACRALELSRAELDAQVRLLARLELLRSTVAPESNLVAVPPDLAATRLLGDREWWLRQQEQQIATVRGELLSLSPAYSAAQRARRELAAVDVVEDIGMVRHLLADHARRARQELLIAHPGAGMSDEGIARSLSLDLLMLKRGVRMRTVLQHSTRHHRGTQRYVEMVTPYGAQVRTAAVVPRRVIVFDAETAFIPLEGGDHSRGAVVVRESSVVEHLKLSFQVLWSDARSFRSGPEEQPEVREEIESAILNLLAQGAKDEVIARKLAMSVRTCRRHISAIAARLGANSRFQVGLLAERMKLLA